MPVPSPPLSFTLSADPVGLSLCVASGFTLPWRLSAPQLGQAVLCLRGDGEWGK